MPIGVNKATAQTKSQRAVLQPMTSPPPPRLSHHQPPGVQQPSSQCTAGQPLQNSLPTAAAAAPEGWLAVLSEPTVNFSGWVPQQPAASLGYGAPAQQLPLSSATGLACLPVAPHVLLAANAGADAAACARDTAAAADARLFCSERLEVPSSTPTDTSEAARRNSAASCQDAWHPWASQQMQQAAPQHAALRSAAILRRSARLSMPPQPQPPLSGLLPTLQRLPASPSLDDDLIASFLNDGPDSGLSSHCEFGSEDSTAARM